MAKKVNKSFRVDLVKNNVKGGAWLAMIVLSTEGSTERVLTLAWSNPSAAKRWVKEQVQEHTPRKSVKLTAGENLDEKGKPVTFHGELLYKAEA